MTSLDLELVLDALPNAVVVCDGEGRVAALNAEAACLFGAEEALLGRDLRDLTQRTSGGERLGESRIDELCEEEEGGYLPEELLVRPDGTTFWAECWVRPLLREGTRVGTVLTFIDISARKDAEAEHARVLAELEEAVRLRDDFLAIASHELRTPLTPLQLHVQSI